MSVLCCATIRFSSTVMPRNSLMFWKVRATRALALMSWSSSRSSLIGRSVRMVELHHPLGRLVEAGDAVEHGGLAGAVRPDQRGDVLAPDIEGHIVDGDEPAEAHGQVLDLEQGFGLPPPHARPSLTRSPRDGARALRA